MNEIKFGLQISNIMIYLASSTWGVTSAQTTPYIFHLRGDLGPPHTPEIEIFNVALEYDSLIQIHSLI